MEDLRSELETGKRSGSLAASQTCVASLLTAFFSPFTPHVARRVWRQNADGLKMMSGGGGGESDAD